MELYRFAPAQIYNIDNNGNFQHQDLFWKKQAVVKSETVVNSGKQWRRKFVQYTLFSLSGWIWLIMLSGATS